ncbi:MAG: hypothetical protein WEE50_11655, partial [Chloroflexota bacterium]
ASVARCDRPGIEEMRIGVTERDEIVPAELSRRVFDAAAEPKRYVPLAASHHNDPALLAGEEMLAAVTSFLDDGLGIGRV